MHGVGVRRTSATESCHGTRIGRIELALPARLEHDGFIRPAILVQSPYYRIVSTSARDEERGAWSRLQVTDDSDDIVCGNSASQFLAALEQSGILSESGVHEIRNRLVTEPRLRESSALAEELVDQGRLTEFQARRLLVGKISGLVFGRYILIDRLGKGSMGRVLKARHRLMDRVVALKVVSPAYASSLNSVGASSGK